MKKRILSCVLSAALLLGLTPWSALATDDPLEDQTSQTELQANFQSPPQDPDIYADPQPNITIPENTLQAAAPPMPVAAAAPITDEAGLKNAITDGAAIQLGDNITTTSTITIPEGASVTLDLNGKAITADFSDDVINVVGTLTLKDSGTGGTITHGMNGSSKYMGRGVKVDGGTFIMKSGSIAGNQFDGIGDGRGCGVFVKRGTFNMEGGSIQNNNSTYMLEAGSSYGGGVYVATNATFHMSDGTISNNAVKFLGGGVYISGSYTGSGGTFTMSGGSITGNQAGDKGGGVGIDLNATFTMTGGSITSNTADKKGSGVYVNDSSCRFTVSGTPKITDNNGSNVYLNTGNGATFTIGEGGLKSGAKIGVSVENILTQAQSVSIATGADNGYADNSIFADFKGSTYLVRRIDNEIMLLGSSSAHVNHNKQTFEHKLSMKDNKPCIDGTTTLTLNPNYPCYELPAGSYYLSGDLTLNYPLAIVKDSSTVTLCLNGHTISANGKFDVLTIPSKTSGIWNVTLNLYDCVGTGTITHTSGSGCGVSNYGHKSTFNMYGGTISNNTTTGSGGGVIVGANRDNIFNMYDGTISGNTTSGSGGGVFMDYGTFNMYGGTITGNTANVEGGGVFVNGYGTFNLQDGTISNNKSTASRKSSYEYGGGGVYAIGKLNLSGGTITGNTATADGNGVFVKRSASVTLSGDVQIKDNIKDNAQSNLYLSNGAAFTVGDLDSASIGVKTSDALTKGDAVKIATGAGDVDVTGKITSDDSYDVKTINGEVYLANGEVHMHPICGDQGESVKWKPIGTAEELNAITSAGNYYLTADIELTTAWQPKNGVKLCLNGHSVTRTSSDGDFTSSDSPIYHGTIYVNQDVTFKLCDCNGSGNGNGIITHSLNPKATSIPYIGSGVYLAGGTLELYGGKITGNYTGASSSNGGGVTVSNNGTLKQYGGEITNNKSSTGGGGVRIHGGTAYLYGGKISNNQARYGGGVCIYSNGKFYAYGGEIKDNKLIDKNNDADCGGGVYLYRSERSGTNKNELHIKGNVQIINNKAMDGSNNNVYLESYYSGTWGNYVDLSDSMIADGALDAAAKIGVTPQRELSYYTDSKAAIVTNLDAANQENYSSIFSYDVSDKEYALGLDGTTLYLKGHQHGDWTYDSHYNTITVKCGSTLGTCGLADRIAGTYTITAPSSADLIYNGSAKAATVTATPKSGVTLPAAPAIQYQKKTGDPLESAPTDVGDYTASITVDRKTATVDYTIQPKTIGSFTYGGNSLTYNGTEQTCPELNVKDGSVTLKAGTDYNTISGTTTGTNAGTYPLQITFCGNYKRDDSKPVDIRWKIDPLTVELFWQNVTDRTYNDGKIVTATVGNKCRADDDVSVTVIGGDGNEYNVTYHATATELTGKDAGNYTLIGCKTEDLNQSYTIGKGVFQSSVTMADYGYGATPSEPDVDNNPGNGGVTYSYHNADSDCANATLNTWSADVKLDAGTYCMHAQIGESSSYQSVAVGGTQFKVNPKELATEMVTSIANQTYTGEALSTTATLKDGETVLEAGPDKDYEITGYVDNTNAGTATAIIEGRGNYTGKISVPWTIDRRFLGAPVFSSAVLTKVYDGTDAAATNFDVSYFRDNDSTSSKTYKLTKDTDYKIVRAYYETPDVGDKITIRYALQLTNTNYAFARFDDYYMGIDGQIAEPGVITQARQTISVPQDKTLVKNGAGVDISQWVSVSGVEGGSPAGELSYALNGTYPGVTLTGSTLTAAKNATANTVTIKVTAAATKNYESAETTFSVKLSDKLFQSNFQFASGLISKTYGDDSFTMTATGAAEGSMVSYESSNPNVATVDNTGKVTIVGTGNATITATAAETKDYVSASAAYTLMVARAELTITAKDQSAYIGDKVPELGADSYIVTGLVKGESLTTALTILPTVRYVDKNGQKVEPDMTKAGETVIRASGAEASGNYVIVAFTDGKLTVSARPSSGGGGGSSTPSYPVSTPSKGGNGSVSSNAKNAASGSTVTITVKPDSGYQLETLAVTDHRGNALKLTDQGNGTYTFTMPSGQVDVKATFTQAADETSPFDDVSKDDYYYDAVKWAADSGITGGVGGSLFGSDQSCTRAQIITFLWRAAGSPEPKGAANMTDVPQDAYYAKAVAWAMENGITSGTGADRFSPHAACTRAQGMTFLFRSSKASASGTLAFQDVAADAYYAQAVKWAADNGITSGIGGGLFGPDNGCTRAQIVTFLWKLYAGK